ncbi:hypothetical protein KIW84_070697 [Lathyrus oleraceus]|uniref:Uncharacterized protein n=1 Tax=Pisum sativum TaxID=3888 RepID=A0A9D4ZUX7_PEA|nr:hypothetical protein KIW84_070697 [Pisum sativum]
MMELDLKGYQDGTRFNNNKDYQAKRVCVWTEDVAPGKNWITNKDYQDRTGFNNQEDYQAKRVCLWTKDVASGKNWITNKDYQDRTGFNNHEDYQVKRVCLWTEDVTPGKNWITNKDYQDRTGFKRSPGWNWILVELCGEEIRKNKLQTQRAFAGNEVDFAPERNIPSVGDMRSLDSIGLNNATY